MMGSILRKRGAGYIAALLGSAAVTAICAPFHDKLDHTTVTMALLLVVLLVARVWGAWPGRFASLVGALCFDFYFLPPVYSLSIAHVQDWMALAAFFIAASTVGHLSVLTKRRAAEAEAGRREARLAGAYNRRLLEASLDPLVSIGPDGRITDVNAATEMVTGRSRAELIGTDFSDYFTEPEKAREGYQRVFREGFVRDYALEIRHRDGHITSVLYNASVYRDDSGKVIGVFAAARDITERQEAEQALLESEANLKRAQEIAHVGSWNLDIAHNRLTWSDEGYRIFGVPKGTPLTHQAFLDTVYLEDRDFVEKAWAAALQGAPYDIEHRILVGGEINWVRERARVEFDKDGKTIGIGTVQDITARKRAEDQIRTLNAELEQRVMARTAELQTANNELAQAREREADIGFKIQQNLLLDQPPADLPGLRVAALTIPSQRIDGDFYIFIKHDDSSLDVIVGDVMGKGIPAALLGAATKSHFLKALSDLMGISRDDRLPEPREIVMLAHAQLVRHLIDLDSFVTLCYARLDVNRRIIDLVDCGHTGIIQWHGKTGACEILHGDNLPLGVREGEIYDQISIPFEPGDSLFFFSDGITETRNPAGEFFGEARLQEYIRVNGQLEPAALVEGIRKAVFTFSESTRLLDDLTSVAIQVEDRQAPLMRQEIDLHSDLKELGRAREFVRTFDSNLPGGRLDEDSAAALELAVNEATSNIMKHAYHGRSDQSIHLEGEAFPDRVVIQLHHFGDSFDPSTAPPPPLDGSRDSGFGAYIIARSVDEVRYYRDERGRNCIALMKTRKAKEK
jgi:PAS domain S-box-containing protein